jgi:hypothetical protein
MRIVVFEASSGISRELVLQARTGGHHAVAIARSIRSEAAASLTLVPGSVLDPGVCFASGSPVPLRQSGADGLNQSNFEPLV